VEIELTIDGSGPIYRQIADGIARRITCGDLVAGERLPTIRSLAERLGVTRPTVHRAFRELTASGLVVANVGRGTFVRGPRRRDSRDRERRRRTPDRVMAEIMRADTRKDVIGLAHAEPDPRLVPAFELWDCFAALRKDAIGLMQYAPSQGDPELRVELARLTRARGIEVEADDVIVTSGVTQGLSLAAQVLARPGDVVAVEQPTYVGLLQILEERGLSPRPVRLDDDGPDLAALEQLVRAERPRFLYTIPTFHNPTGRSMTGERRRRLLELAARHDLWLIEDDIYHRLAYDGPPPPALRGLAGGADRVIYLDGLSKAVLPGLRAGWCVPPRSLRARFLSARRAADLCGSLPLMRALQEFLRRGLLDSALERALPRYRSRRDALLDALERHMPPTVRWTRPGGGFSCWLTLPAGFDDFYQVALDDGIMVAPGDVFVAEPGPLTQVRICFGATARQSMAAAVARLATLVESRLSDAPAAGTTRPLV